MEATLDQRAISETMGAQKRGSKHNEQGLQHDHRDQPLTRLTTWPPRCGPSTKLRRLPKQKVSRSRDLSPRATSRVATFKVVCEGGSSKHGG